MQLIEGKKIAGEIRLELKREIEALSAKGNRLPGLVAILVGENPASQIYVRSKARACAETGIIGKTEILKTETTEEELLQIVKSYNEDPSIDGILVQLPLPKHIDENKIIEAISPSKDVDGFHPMNLGNLMIGRDCFYPCTPYGILELIKRYGIDTLGKHVVVLGRSNIVGKPVANMLLQKKAGANAVVTVCHSAAKNIKEICLSADIIIAAIGVPGFIKADMVKEGAAVIDVGINRVKDLSLEKGYRVVGDVDFAEVSPKASFITPVPGGVGPMTIAMLLKNTFEAYKRIEKGVPNG